LTIFEQALLTGGAAHALRAGESKGITQARVAEIINAENHLLKGNWRQRKISAAY